MLIEYCFIACTVFYQVHLKRRFKLLHYVNLSRERGRGEERKGGGGGEEGKKGVREREEGREGEGGRGGENLGMQIYVLFVWRDGEREGGRKGREMENRGKGRGRKREG